ncbi:hypothetical protein Pla123a_15040 [Posidoniimonas polymericola]|uniref:Uncharacterized protein n=1 Tax=Posidoniimonas polymericola TaxID=2528002 RepID=A0A5C5YS49_9BACT|nr:hypothetical protein [Posidoniimonas polymericola]TWT77708.1 hypothetical protein Pla123a_15040 [Posidoniimonas polymericola]
MILLTASDWAKTWSACLTTLAMATVHASVLATAAAGASSWVFQPSTYTHDPHTGARVAQYQRHDPVEPLDDPRLVTSRYHRSHTTLRGGNGSVDTTYEVQSYGNDRGGLDAQWERFHDAWRQSYLTGSYYRAQPAPYGGGYGPGYGGGYPGYGYPGYGGGYGGPTGYYPPVYGPPAYGPPIYRPGFPENPNRPTFHDHLREYDHSPRGGN